MVVENRLITMKSVRVLEFDIQLDFVEYSK